jgi:hypothetical protein
VVAGSSDWLINAASQENLDEGRLLAETGPKGASSDLFLSSKANDPLNDGHWHHVVLTRTITGDTKLFVDGALHAAGNDGGGNVVNDRGINIGGERIHPGGMFLNGDMDEVAIYPRVLSPDRIQLHFQAIAKHLPPRPEKRNVRYPPGKEPEPTEADTPLEPVRPLKEKIVQASKTHWAYQALRSPTSPKVKQASWIRNSIDAWVLAKLEARGLAPAPQASAAILLRRASSDLLGLPPEELNPSSWPESIEALLASPHYGERYARHWLDVARYADSAGYELDNFYQHAWRYRDYVIRAFNADKPFDRFIREQIAADLMDGTDDERAFATG